MTEACGAQGAFDLVLPFQLDRGGARGRLVRVQKSLDDILKQHAYPATVGKILAEASVIAVAMGSALKYDGMFTLQTKSDGAIRLLVADITGDGGLRAYAQFDADKVAGATESLLGQGYLAFTVDQQAVEERYQGIVSLMGDDLAQAVQHYFHQSEQIPTGIVMAVKQDGGHWRGACLMLQRLPREGGIEKPEDRKVAQDTAVEDDWHRAMMLLRTCTEVELLDPALRPEELLYRLFHEEDVRVYDAKPLRHQCRCSEDRVVSMLQAMPDAEIESMAVNGLVSVTCGFCNKTYDFDEPKRAALRADKVEEK